jgi:aryl-alcohol dehydrogenase-like predicted oxidoreductase
VEYRSFGRTGIKVSPLCLGTMMFGAWGNADHDESVRIIHAGLDAGINFVDTSNNYSEGESETIVGKALQGRRDGVVLATKVFAPVGLGPNDRGLSRKTILQQVELSLGRLKTDYIDLYQIHRPDPTTPWEETISTLNDLVRQGKVRYVGCSTNHQGGEGPWDRKLGAWEIVETFWISERRGWERFASLQPPYSILRRTMEVEHFPMSRRFGMANMIWSPLEGGWLTGKYRKGRTNPSDSPRAERWVGDVENPRFKRRLDVVENLVGLAERLGVPLAELATAWTLKNPDVTATIIGPRTAAQLDGAIRSLDVAIPPEALASIDEWVPPGTSVL